MGESVPTRINHPPKIGNVPPSPSVGLKKGWTSRKVPRKPGATGKSPWCGVAHSLQSKECPYASWRSMETMSLDGFITWITHLLYRVGMLKVVYAKATMCDGLVYRALSDKGAPSSGICLALKKASHGPL